MSEKNDRRAFLRNLSISGLGLTMVPNAVLQSEPAAKQAAFDQHAQEKPASQQRKYNGSYTGDYLKRIAFPIGGLGAGMFCMEGTGAFSHMSVRHRPEIFHEPGMFAAI